MITRFRSWFGAARITLGGTLIVAVLAVVAACGTSKPKTTVGPSFAQLGAGLVQVKPCLVCHTTSGASAAGPTFAGMAGSRVTLSDGTTVVADDAFLKRSILEPSAQTVAGFPPGLMATLIRPGSISPRQADEIVAYLHTLASPVTH